MGKPKDSSDSQQPSPPRSANTAWDMVNEEIQRANLPGKAGDGTDFGDIIKKASQGAADKKPFSDVLTETLDNTSQSPSIQVAKVLTSGQRAYRTMEKANETIGNVDRRDFLKWTGLGVLFGIFGSLTGEFFGLFDGLKKAFGVSPSGNFFTQYREGYEEGLSGQRFVEGRIIDAGIALGVSLSDENETQIMGDGRELRPYMMQVMGAPQPQSPDYSGKVIFFSPLKTYPTPEGSKTGKQILKDFSGTDLDNYTSDPQSRKFNYVKAGCGDPFPFTDSSGTTHETGYALKQILIGELY